MSSFMKTRLKQDQCGGYLDVLAQISMGSAGRGQVFLPGIKRCVCVGHVNVNRS